MVKVRSYMARYPVHGTVQSALRSFQCHFHFSGEHSATVQLLREDVFVHIPICVCSQVFIYTGEKTVSTRDDRNCQSFDTAARGLKPGFSRRSNRYAIILMI